MPLSVGRHLAAQLSDAGSSIDWTEDLCLGRCAGSSEEDVNNSGNITFNRPTFSFVCHAEHAVYPSTQLLAIILAETMLAEASATVSGGEGGEGIKTVSTQEVATAHTKAYNKINSDDKVAIVTVWNTMKEGTQDIDLHVRATACLNARTKAVENLNGLQDIIERHFGNDPNALMAMSILINRTYFSLDEVGYVLLVYLLDCAAKKIGLRFIEDGNDVQALANIDVVAESLCGVSIDRGAKLMIQTQTATAYEITKKRLSTVNDMKSSS